jgi:hypothetical protein
VAKKEKEWRPGGSWSPKNPKKYQMCMNLGLLELNQWQGDRYYLQRHFEGILDNFYHFLGTLKQIDKDTCGCLVTFNTVYNK